LFKPTKTQKKEKTVPKCPFATWKVITGGIGVYTSGPFKIVHHTTEGSTASGAFSTYAKRRNDPHFTIEADLIYQHIDTNEGARSLRNEPGGVQTNRESAVQIEVVGYAHLPKDGRTLISIARLCRWIEKTHEVLPIWPNGPPVVATENGNDPGGHNRDPKTWASLSGHFGHCSVPENSHWDPGYTQDEVRMIMELEFESTGRVAFSEVLSRYENLVQQRSDLEGIVSTMPDH